MFDMLDDRVIDQLATAILRRLAAPTQPLLDKEQLAERLNVTVSWVDRATAARSIPITWIGRHPRWSEQDIADILAAGREVPESASEPAPAAAPAPLSLVTGPRPPAGPATPGPPAGPKHGRQSA